MEKKKKINYKNLIIILGGLVCLVVFIYSLTNIILWAIDNNNTKKQTELTKDLVEITEVEDSDTTEIIAPSTEVEQDRNNPYWNYIKMNLISVDFTELKKTNADTVAWIQVNGTNINYPVVQTSDNKYYLNHSFDKTKNNAGWVFMDYRNNVKEFNKNTILYAHGRVDKTMFGSLKNVLTNGWLKNKDNFVVKLSTEEENTLWQVFSIYHIPTTNDYIKVFFTPKEFQEFATMLIARSQYDFNVTVADSDQILTLSTCYNNDEKIVMHAKLIKKELRIS